MNILNIRHTLTAVLGLLLAGATAMAGAPEASDMFAAAPDEIFPLLTPTRRLELIEYFKNMPGTKSHNEWDGPAYITDMSPESLSVKVANSADAQIAMLPAKSDTVVALINTVATPGLDSTVSFYTTGWELLPEDKYLTVPDLKEWVVKGASAAEVAQVVPFMLASAVYDAATATLTFTNHLDAYLDTDTYTAISPSLHRSIDYRWNGKRFVRSTDK